MRVYFLFEAHAVHPKSDHAISEAFTPIPEVASNDLRFSAEGNVH